MPNEIPSEFIERMVRMESAVTSTQKSLDDMVKEIASLRIRMEKASDDISHAKAGLSAGLWMWRVVVVPLGGLVGYLAAKLDILK